MFSSFSRVCGNHTALKHTKQQTKMGGKTQNNLIWTCWAGTGGLIHLVTTRSQGGAEEAKWQILKPRVKPLAKNITRVVQKYHQPWLSGAEQRKNSEIRAIEQSQGNTAQRLPETRGWSRTRAEAGCGRHAWKTSTITGNVAREQVKGFQNKALSPS